MFLFTDFYFKLFLHCNPKRSYFLYFVLLKHNPFFKTETCENGKKTTGTIAFRFRQVLLYQCALLSHLTPTLYNVRRDNVPHKPVAIQPRRKLLFIIIIIVIQPLGRSGQRPELSQATGMALVRCILGKFLGVACHCFPPDFF